MQFQCWFIGMFSFEMHPFPLNLLCSVSLEIGVGNAVNFGFSLSLPYKISRGR